MTTAPSDVPVVAGRGRVVVAVVLLVLAVVGALALRLTPLGDGAAPVACTVLAGDRDVRPPAVVAQAAARVRDDVAADVTTTCSLTDGVEPDPGAADPADDPAGWVVAVTAEAADVAALPATAADLLAAASPAAPFAWHLDVHDAARTVAVVLTPGGGTGLVDDAVALRGGPGVGDVRFAPDGGTVAVATGADLAPLLAATAGRELPGTTVEVQDDWLEVQQVHPGTWPDAAAVALAVDVAAWQGVWRVVLSGGAPASPRLSVEADDDAHRAHVASRLEATVHTGPTLGFAVSAQQEALNGVVGGAAAGAGEADGRPDDGPAAGPDGVPACAGDGLRVEVVGHDAALGARFLVLRATHTGAAPCVVSGVPGLAFTRLSGTRTPDLTQLPDLVAPEEPAVAVLAPGESVTSQVRWRAMSTTQDPDVAVGVTVRPVVGGPTVDLTLPDPLDVLAGATVRVGPWLPGAGGTGAAG